MPPSPPGLSGGCAGCRRRTGRRRAGGRATSRTETPLRRMLPMEPNSLAGAGVGAAFGAEEGVLEEARVLPQRRALATPRGRGAGQRVACRVDARRSLRAARRGRALRHQQLQLRDRRQVVHRAAQVAHAAGRQHRLLDLQHAPRVAAVGVQVDGGEHAPVGAADGEGDVDRAQQLVPVAHLLRIGGLREAHQRQLGQHDVVRQRLAQLSVDATLVGAEHRPRGQVPFGGQGRGPRRARARPPPRQQTGAQRQRRQGDDPGKWLLRHVHGRGAYAPLPHPGRQAMTVQTMLQPGCTPRPPRLRENALNSREVKPATSCYSRAQSLCRPESSSSTRCAWRFSR